MKKYALLALLALPSLLQCMELTSDRQEGTADYEGRFTLALLHDTPCYAGFYKNNILSSEIKQSARQIKRKIEPNELIFQILAWLKVTKPLTNKERLKNYQGQAWRKLHLSDYVPYQELKDLHEGDTLNFYTQENEKVCLTIDTKFFLNDLKGNFQKSLFTLLCKAKEDPTYMIEDRDKLIENNILELQIDPKNNEEIEYVHGPKGFDFSILKNHKDQN